MNDKRFHWLCLFICCLGMAACSKQRDDSTTQIRRVAVSRVVKIPAQFWTSNIAARQNPGVLTVTQKSEDELPQGPEGFEVLPDGGFAITDPLQRRLVFYDSLGDFRAAWPIGFAANSVTALPGGAMELRDAKSGEIVLFDAAGQRLSARAAVRSRGAGADARLLELNRGVIARPRTRGSAPGDLQVDFASDSSQMVSLQNLGVDAGGNTYVALEAARGSDVIDIQKIIRKYAADNTLICQITDIPLDYYVPPVNEFRIRAGQVYQLLPQEKEVIINIWNTNP
jgi:hypothetical protein